jgi:transcriptional regulator with XRE-family HTH domain
MSTSPTTTAWRSWRETLGLSLREVARRAEINPGRLSIIERGVPPTPVEAGRLRAVLVAASI